MALKGAEECAGAGVLRYGSTRGAPRAEARIGAVTPTGGLEQSLGPETIVKIAAGLEIEPGKLVNGLPAPNASP